MFSPELHILVRKEIQKDHLKRVGRQKMLRAIEHVQPVGNSGRKMTHWLGVQMVLWGSKLQTINTASPAEIVVNPK